MADKGSECHCESGDDQAKELAYLKHLLQASSARAAHVSCRQGRVQPSCSLIPVTASCWTLSPRTCCVTSSHEDAPDFGRGVKKKKKVGWGREQKKKKKKKEGKKNEGEVRKTQPDRKVSGEGM